MTSVYCICTTQLRFHSVHLLLFLSWHMRGGWDSLYITKLWRTWKSSEPFPCLWPPDGCVSAHSLRHDLADIVFTRCFDLSVPSSVPETLEIKLAFTKLGIRTVILTGEKARGCKPHVRSVCLSYQTSVLVTHPSSNLASPKFVLFFAAGWGSSIYTLCVKPLGVLQAHRIRVRP